MKEKERKYQKGITLIALVITIIVLLILAGVTLRIVMNGGIIDKSQNAVDKYSQAQQNETEILDYLNKQFSLHITVLDNINGSENKKVIEQTPDIKKYCNPVVPVGFKTVNTETASWEVVEDETLGKVVKGWNDGLVIEDKEGNQFVWVPVDGKNVKYDKYLFSKNLSAITNAGISSLSDDTSAIPVSDETAQITKYGGFYIARYAAGKQSSGTTVPLSKYNQTVWNNIDYNDANTYAKSYKTGNSYVLSGLVTGRMWDATMKWIAATDGLDIIQNDSSSWGVYSGDGLKNTGVGTSSKNTSKKNIYDLAGNVWEWTAEVYSIGRVFRGGGFDSDGFNHPAAYRNYTLDTGSVGTLRFQSSTFCTIARESYSSLKH